MMKTNFISDLRSRAPLSIKVTVKRHNGSISNYSILRDNVLQPTVRKEVPSRRLPDGRLNISSGEDACFQ